MRSITAHSWIGRRVTVPAKSGAQHRHEQDGDLPLAETGNWAPAFAGEQLIRGACAKPIPDA